MLSYNFLNFVIFDLNSNIEIHKFIARSGKSIVIEDLNSNIEIHKSRIDFALLYSEGI
ncbi:hypothetical protein HMPREF1501_2532 [Fusobacterium sp. OBRC1]|nr:hypothetical protein HMPREF1501_2532 [Fusobacterium sp. OBRC1]